MTRVRGGKYPAAMSRKPHSGVTLGYALIARARRSAFFHASLMLVIPLIVVACSSGDPVPTAQPSRPVEETIVPGMATPSPAPTPTPIAKEPSGPVKRGGVLKQGDRPTARESFQTGIRNPDLGTAHPVASRLIFQTLFKHDPYNDNVFTGLLADEWQFTDDARSLSVHVEPTARWADGLPVTAEDVKFSLDHYADPPQDFTVNGAARSVGRTIEHVEIVDRDTVSIVLSIPDVSILVLLADPDVPIRPAHRTLEQSAGDPIGSGPYRFSDVEADIKFEFERNPNYWVRDDQGGRLPYLDGVENLIVSDGNRAFASILLGQIDVLNANWVSTVLGEEGEIKRRMPGAFVQKLFGVSVGWGVKNIPPFNNPLVIQALSILTDRLAVVEIDFTGFGAIDGAGVTPASSGNLWGLPTAEVLSHPGWRYVHRETGELETDMFKLQAGLSDVYRKDPGDIELGKRLLREAGLDPDRGEFPKISLTVSGRYEAHSVILSGTLSEYLGVRLPVDLRDPATVFQLMGEGRFEAVVSSIYPATLEPSETLKVFTTGGGPWKHGFEVPELDALFARQRQEVDPAKRRDIVWEFQRRFLDSAHVIPEATSFTPVGLIREWVRDFPVPVGRQSNVYDLERVWLDT